MIPLYRLMVNFNWIDTYFALILPWAITPFGIFLLKQFIEKIPLELEDSARIDGANDLQILIKIIFPISKPVIMVLILYTFLANWNSFLFPFLFTNSDSMRTLPVGLTFFLGKQSINWGQLMAGASIAALPMILLFFLFKKQILNAMLFGGLKE
jgi:multiple sugar transport system permease protein